MAEKNVPQIPSLVDTSRMILFHQKGERDYQCHLLAFSCKCSTWTLISLFVYLCSLARPHDPQAILISLSNVCFNGFQSLRAPAGALRPSYLEHLYLPCHLA